MGNIKDVICIYNEKGNNIEDIMLKLYEDFVQKELIDAYKL